ncbi:GNAT family protein [Dactylosporangium sp. AC04546]|uniref:GNAT family N-acetyltransferase n=1 Tax=Dactylosporangium sp. AC04546 TaxID=2862460 RepID=UPI001EDE8F4D|nr:GNAT family protein [Dactylosporangium sp. AC04546]WVK84660.1 GNAT family protein [Dactylosporangium sp. AC04546]
MSQPGWPAVLTDGPITLRPYRRSDARAWSEVRRANEQWLSKWEPTPYGTWSDLNSTAAFRAVHADLRRAARQGHAMPFAVCYDSVLVGQLTLGNIVRRAFCSGYAGYWVDSRYAGKGIIPTALALVVDHAFSVGGLHRVEVNIRPDNLASRRVVEKLGFRQEAYHHRYLHIDGDWRDHLGYAMTTEDLTGEGGLLARWHKVSAAA